MKRFPHPRRECACESSRAGASQARYCKKVPEKGDENIVMCISEQCLYFILKKGPRERGRKPLPSIGLGVHSLLLKKGPRERGRKQLDAFYFLPVVVSVIEKKSPRKGTKPP